MTGTFALTGSRDDAPDGYAKVGHAFQNNDDGLIDRIYFVLASRKLVATP